MKAQVESISPVKTRLSIEVSEEEVAKEEETAYRDLRRTTNVPGFRKGKAPISMLKRLYRGRVRSDILDRLIKSTYRETIEKEKIVPVSEADIQLQSDPAEGGLSYTAVVEVLPVVEPREYKGLKFTKERVSVEEAEVDSSIETLRSARATLEPAPEDHPVGDGDMVVVDYEAFVDGEALGGSTAVDQSVVINSERLLPGLNQGLKGMVAGEVRIIDVEYPEDHEHQDLAGKEAQLRVEVKEIKTRILPDLDDEFASEVADVSGVEELRDRVRKALETEKNARVEQQFNDRVIDSLLEGNPFEVPESMVRGQQKLSMDRMRQDLEKRGIDPVAAGFEEPRVQEAHQRAAERGVRWAFLMRAIAEAEETEVTDQEVDERIEAIAKADGRPVSMVRSFFETEDGMDSLRSSILESKVIDRVVASATVEEVETEDVREVEDPHE